MTADASFKFMVQRCLLHTKPGNNLLTLEILHFIRDTPKACQLIPCKHQSAD